MTTRTSILRLFAAATCLFAWQAAHAQAAGFPNKPVTLLVPFAAGGPTDQMARALGEVLSERLGQPVVVDPRPGAGGQIAGMSLMHNPADGYTVMLGETSVLASNASLYKKFAYNPITDLQPVGLLMSMPMLLYVPKNSYASSLKDLAALGQEKTLNYASQGAGSLGHLMAEVFKKETHSDLNHVPYKGSAPAMVDLIGGQVDLLFDGLAPGRPYVLDGRLKALAIAAPQRSPLLPQVPTMAEQGQAGQDASVWYGAVVRAGTPAPVARRLADEIAAALKNPRFAQRFQDQGFEVGGMDLARFREYIKAENERWGKVIRAHAIAVD